ncbi:MAG: hypothetical protein IJ943_04885 [Akkermansia sp.]|nr:hypothetical protein [Akkermansia sp.]
MKLFPIITAALLGLSAIASAFEQHIRTLLNEPGNAEAFYQLSLPDARIDAALRQLSESEQEQLSTLLTYRELYAARSRKAENPGREFVLHMRDFIGEHRTFSERLQGLEEWLSSPAPLTLTELDMLRRAMMAWCGNFGRRMVDARYAHEFLRDYRDGRPVVLPLAREQDIARHMHHALSSFIQTERTLNAGTATTLSNGRDRVQNLLAALIWQDEHAALALARGKNLFAYELLSRQPEDLPRWLMSRGILHNNDFGFDIPESCLTALHVHRWYKTPARAAAQLRKQNADLPDELQALAPRCMLALGGGLADWQPLTESSPHQGCNPRWPDASAPTLPQWSPALLGLPDEKPTTLSAAFDKSLESLEKHLAAAKEHHGTSAILAAALEECAAVRPGQRDMELPIYLRLAFSLEQDGLTIDFAPEYEELTLSCRDADSPIIQAALHHTPQLLHRLTLLLAVMEKQGHAHELGQSCMRLARVLNRSGLWPLIICQRELRGVSPLALTTLFTHYEGELAPLPHYGEAMGMTDEMTIAALGHEDTLADNLRRAATVSGTLTATDEQRKQAAAELLALAKEHAQDNSPELTARVISHLLRHGMTDTVLAWPECPVRCLSGQYAMSGLRLVHALKTAGKMKEAAQLVAAMQKEGHMPATRLAAAALCTDEAQAARLRRDALLLAMLWQVADEQVYRDCVEYLMESGEAPDEAMKLELLCSNGQRAGLTPALAAVYHRQGDARRELFVWEYLLAIGVSTATPYGDTPSHADIVHYRNMADKCIETIIRQSPTQQPQPSLPAAPAPTFDTAALPTREWKRRNAPTVTGQLVALYDTPAAIRVLKADGSTELILLSELAEKVDSYLAEWRSACGFSLWEWKNPPWYLANFSKVWGKPIAAYPDFNCPGQHILVVRKPDGDTAHLRCLGLAGAQAKQAADFCKSYAPQSALKLATSPGQAAELAAAYKLPVLVICCAYGDTPTLPGYNVPAATRLQSYLASHPEAAAVWGNSCILLPAPFKQLPNGSFGYPAQEKEALLKLEAKLCPNSTPGAETPLARAMKAVSSNNRPRGIVICWLNPQHHECGTLNINPISTRPEEALQTLTPLP